jgi:hypothetical protein
MIYEALLGVSIFFCTIPIWIFLYKHYLGNILADIYVKKIEDGSIDLNYLLDEGGVFDELSERIITRFKQNMLADMGQMANQSSSGKDGVSVMGDQAAMGIEAAGELLRMVGMKKPPAMLQYKVANALGKMLDQQKPDDDAVGRFFPDRP